MARRKAPLKGSRRPTKAQRIMSRFASNGDLKALGDAGLASRVMAGSFEGLAVLRGRHAVWVGPIADDLSAFWASSAWKAHQAGERRIPSETGRTLSKEKAVAMQAARRRKACQGST